MLNAAECPAPVTATLSHLAWRPASMSNHPPPKRVQSFTKAVWFFLGQNGGRWGSAEIIDRLKITSWKRKAQAAYIGEMANSRLITRYRDEDNRIVYGVTRKNKIPRDLTLEEVEQLLGIRFCGDEDETRL